MANSLELLISNFINCSSRQLYPRWTSYFSRLVTKYMSHRLLMKWFIKLIVHKIWSII